MSIREQLRERIRAERAAQAPWGSDRLAAAVTGGERIAARDNLLFFTPPAEFAGRLNDLRQALAAALPAAPAAEQEEVLRFLADMAVSLHSFLPAWNLRPALSEAQLATEAEATAGLAARLAGAAKPGVVSGLLTDWRAYAKARLEAEKAADPAAMAAGLVGDSIGHYIERMSAAVSLGYLRRIAEARLRGETITELGNDYAAYLDYAMYLGISFETTNPPLIDLAWTADPERWNAVVDRIIAANPTADDEELARLVTLEVVLANMRLLRPIFLLSEGRLGLVSLQVNPKKHGDAAAMIADATAIYAELQRKLEGRVPNVVFKMPATYAGLTACGHLTKQGIGVNITVNFGLYQEMPFAQAIAGGEALASYLTEMNGRLAFPVRDELLAKAASLGLSETQAREAAAWSGVAIHKRLMRLLREQGYDLERVRPLVASLRWYAGAGYEALPDPCPDVIDDMGTTVITIFPNIRHALDAAPNLPFDGKQIEAPVPEAALQVLEHSEVFKQGYYLPGDDARFRPATVLTLEDEADNAAWLPVAATLNEFCNAYDKFVARIAARRPA
ncbi:MAG TPA: transaldolase family protein [Anaerolineae bacterium]|nr:transaldolase family protein [Anaerolineae bacterium]HOR01094.1 transaldolase family protein [Anaerolineae bacterium]HPL29016.1 transaldolase family protein [Anaerolineae bacterium]